MTNTMFEESVRLSVNVPVWILAFRITDILFASMTNIRIFTGKCNLNK